MPLLLSSALPTPIFTAIHRHLFRLAAVPRGLQILHNYLPLVSKRLPYLMHFTLSSLVSLKHSNGSPLVELHSPSTPNSYSPSTHGAVISLSLLRPDGERVPPHEVEHSASRANIHVRAGCLCNPGASSTLLGLAPVLANFDIKTHDANGNIDTPAAVVESYATNENMERLIRDEGVVRISFGLASSLADAASFVNFARTFVDVQQSVTEGKSSIVAPKLRKLAEAEIIREEVPSSPTRSNARLSGHVIRWNGFSKLTTRFGRRVSH